ncbi:FAD-binding oxidoreductase [Rubrivivax sp. RP6-9]|uniref:FAD-binding oxidoreductase n=1 Tax=Rubrivivax sp. RP6-9 TaxID=3415750 RepID=UPI003CC6543E
MQYRPGDPVDWPAVRAALAGLDLDDSPAGRQRAAADYHWYSPVLAERLAGRAPDLVVRPRTQAEVLEVAAACARHRVPLTVRGGGTGNYGQCVPLCGGITLDITALRRVLRIEPGWASVEAGVLLHDLNLAARASGQQLCMWPSTERIATLGGFIAGGHSGIGSIRHGILADPGNVRRLRVATLEDPPRVLDLAGADIQKVHHAYGSNGIVLEVDVALTGFVEWQHTIALFDHYDGVLRFGLAAAADPAIDLFQLSAVERRIMPYYAGLRGRLEDRDAMFAQVSPATLPAYAALVQAHGGRLVVQGTEAELLAAGLPSATECAYNHTTLEALKSDRGVTYLQVAYPGPLDADLVARQMQRFGDEVLFHHEFSRAGGERVAFALPLVQYFDEAQLRQLIADFEADGCRIFDPHTWVLEDGGMKQVDTVQLAFKKQADPQGLMNPGKVRAWDEQVLGIAGGQLP